MVRQTEWLLEFFYRRVGRTWDKGESLCICIYLCFEIIYAYFCIFKLVEYMFHFIMSLIKFIISKNINQIYQFKKLWYDPKCILYIAFLQLFQKTDGTCNRWRRSKSCTWPSTSWLLSRSSVIECLREVGRGLDISQLLIGLVAVMLHFWRDSNWLFCLSLLNGFNLTKQETKQQVPSLPSIRLKCPGSMLVGIL